MNPGPTVLDRYRYRIMATLPLSIGVMVATGAAFGILAGLKSAPSDRLFDPFLLFFIPGWLLYCSSQLYRFLKKPRTDSFAFILGLSYKDRRTCAAGYANEAYHTILALAGSIVAPFLAIRLILRGWVELSDSGAIAVMIAIEAIGGIGLINRLLKYYFCRPYRHDRSRVAAVMENARIAGGKIFAFSGRLFLFAAATLSRFAPPEIRPYVRRQVLYLLRTDLFFSVIVSATGFAVAACLSVFVREIGSTAALLADLFIPVAILFANAAAFTESASRLAACPYYASTPRTAFFTNVWVTGMLMAPFCVLALVSVCAGLDGPRAVAAGLTGVLLCTICIIAAFAHCLSFAEWNSGGAAVITLTLFCVFIGAVGATRGASAAAVLVPAVPIAVVGFIRKRDCARSWRRAGA